MSEEEKVKEDVTQERVIFEVTEAVAESAKLSLKEIITAMGFLADVTLEKFERNTIYLSLNGDDDTGLLIGKSGQTMKSLQFIVSTIISKNNQNKIYVKLDINEYWKRHEEEIIASALDAAKVASEEKISVMLEPMNAEERRVVHLAVEAQEDVFTYSEGPGPLKQVVVAHISLQDERDSQ